MAGKEREVDASSLPPLSEQKQLAGSSGPHSVARLPPARWDPLLVRDAPAPPCSYTGDAAQPEPPAPSPRAQGAGWPRRAASCHRPSSPQHRAGRGLGTRGRGPRGEAAPSPPQRLVGPSPWSSACERPARDPRSRPEAATARSPERARPDPLALTVAPRLLLQVGARQGGRRPRRPGARRPAERSHDPQVARHASRRKPSPQVRPERRRCSAAWRRAAQTWAPGARARPGRGRRGRRPIGPRREGAGPAGGTRPLTQPALHRRRGKPSWARARGGESALRRGALSPVSSWKAVSTAGAA